MASGSVHALCAASANTDTDLTPLARLITLADVYVRLSGRPTDTTERLASRQGISPEELHAHAELQESYQQYADSILEDLGRQVVDVTVEGSPEQVAHDIVARIQH